MRTNLHRRGFLGSTLAGLTGAVLATPRWTVLAGDAAPSEQAAGPTIDCGFPGGNIVVERVAGDVVELHQDQRDTKDWWFYWYFRVRGAAARALRFRFTQGNVFAARGPAVSTDAGRSWEWLGAGAVEGDSFSYRFAPDAGDVRFCLAMPYVESNLAEFLARYRGNPHVRVDTLCRSRKGRTVERIHAGQLDGRATHRALLTCRHHACEMMANWALEGILQSVLADDAAGRWFRQQVELIAVPFVDKDGVEDGDQGKLRQPHDHNRDYLGDSLYPEVTALRQWAEAQPRGTIDFFMDMHCPWIRGGRNEEVFFVGSPDAAMWQRQQRFSRLLQRVQRGSLAHDPKHDLPFGQEWNRTKEARIASRYFGSEGRARLALSIEIPYANAGGAAVTPESARELGADLAAAIREWLSAAGDGPAVDSPG